MNYQLEDKKLVLEYINNVFIPDHCKGWEGELTFSSINLPFPLWLALRQAYYNKAVKWKRGIN